MSEIAQFQERTTNGAEWIGQVPDSWTLRPFFSVARQSRRPNKGLVEKNLLSLSYGKIISKDITANEGLLPESFETYQIVEPDDMIFRLTDLQNDQRSLRTALVTKRGIITSAYLCVTPNGINSRFFAHAMRAADHRKVFYSRGDGLRQTLKYDDLKWLWVPFPPLSEQQKVVDFVDRETAKIDAMIKKQNALIDGLRRRKESAVRDVFSAPEADTDARVIPHLGAVPSSWAVRPLWSLYRREKRTGHTDEPMVSVFREHGVVYKDDHANLNVTAEDRSIYQLVEPGWLVVNRMKAWQGSVGVSALRGISSGHYLCFRPLEDLHHPFMNWLFRSPQYRDWFAAHSRGVRPGQAEIDNEHLKSAPVILPPHNEQQRIADHLDRETARIDALIARSERLIDLSQERRAALITAAVTGQIDSNTNAMALEGAA